MYLYILKGGIILENERKSRLATYLRAPAFDAGRNISWSAIFAGVMIFLASMVAFSLVGSAIGFGVPDITSSQPFQGLQTSLIIWAAVSMILSLVAAGFVSGITSARVGLIHGFLTWATSIVVLFSILTFTTVNVFQAAGSLVGKAGNVAGQGVELVVSSAGDAIKGSFDAVTDSVGEVDTKDLQENVEDILEDTDIEELQPDYIEGQLEASQKDITEAAKKIVLDPDNAEKILTDLGTSLQERAEVLGEAVDEDAIANAVEKNTDLSQEEAEKATQNIVSGLNDATTQAQKQIEMAQAQLQQVEQEVDMQVEKIRQSSEEVTNQIAKASLWGFVALLIAMVTTSLAGLWGSRTVHYETDALNK